MPVATSNDHPGLPFVQARGFTAGRPDGPPLWIVFHDMEASETLTRAESTAAYFANPSDGRRVSSHYCADANSVVQCVDLDDSAWTVGNRQGNNRGINWELAGFARQTRAEWLDSFGLAMFRGIAPLVRSDARRFNIPLRWLTDDEVRAMRPGLTTHVQLGRVFGGTTHTDPGPSFPYDAVLQIIQNGVSDMPARFTFQGFPDEEKYFPAKPGGPSRTHVTDGVRYTVQQYSSTADKIKNGAGFGPITNLTPANTGFPTYEIAVKVYCGTFDPGEKSGEGSGGGDGLTLEQVRAVIREELDNTRLSKLLG